MRTVTGFGPAYHGRLAGRFERASDDIQAAIDWAVRYRLTDPDRVGLKAAEAGADLALKAAVDHAERLAALIFEHPRFDRMATLRARARSMLFFYDRLLVGFSPDGDLDIETALKAADVLDPDALAGNLRGPVLTGIYKSMETRREARGRAMDVIRSIENNDAVVYRQFEGEYMSFLDRYYPESAHRDWWAVQLAFLEKHLKGAPGGK
ncbi:MAG: alpha/beta hydrolase family protein [Opitutales bacterium]